MWACPEQEGWWEVLTLCRPTGIIGHNFFPLPVVLCGVVLCCVVLRCGAVVWCCVVLCGVDGLRVQSSSATCVCPIFSGGLTHVFVDVSVMTHRSLCVFCVIVVSPRGRMAARRIKYASS